MTRQADSDDQTVPLAMGWRMTRPAFLWLTVVACALGTAGAAASGFALNGPMAVVTTLLAVLAHAYGNVINDAHDARNGADAANHQGVFPFTGGSRLIQNGSVTERQTFKLAKALLVFLITAGLLLSTQTGPGVLLLGIAGVVLAWAYSAPPLQLMSRGLGELAVALAWFLVVIGAGYVQRLQFSLMPASAAASFALMVAALLMINGVPDAASDACVGKRTLVVRIGTRPTVWVYGALVLLAHVWLAISVWLLIPPASAFWGELSLPFSLAAWAILWRQAEDPQRLKPALALTVIATLLHGIGMAWGFALVAQAR